MTTARLPITTTSTSTRNPSPDNASQNMEGSARIAFRQPVSPAGFIDAAWWPRTRDLTAELPPLMEVLWTAGREISRVTYNLRAWDRAPRRLQMQGRTVHLGGFATSDPLAVRLSDPWGRERVDVLVIGPDTEPAVAQRIFDLASQTGGLSRAQEILDQANGPAPDAEDQS
jgi:hypothetical protein